MTLAAWLLTLIGPLVVRAAIALGVGVLTVSGMNLVLNTALQWVTSSVSGLPSDMANLMALAGFFTGASYVAGALVARVALAGAGSLKRFFLK